MMFEQALDPAAPFGAGRRAIAAYRPTQTLETVARAPLEPLDRLAIVAEGLVEDAAAWAEARPGVMLPQALDFEAERFLLAEIPEEAAPTVFAYPFLHAALPACADTYFNAPLEQCGAWSARGRASRPVMIASIGRCGSTLVSKLLFEAGQRAFSEPDVFAQLGLLKTTPRWEAPTAAPEAMLVEAAAIAVGVLGFADRPTPPVDAPFFIKHRTQANPAMGLMAAATPNARFAVLLRDPAPWAVSTHRAFGAVAGFCADEFVAGLSMLQALRAQGASPLVLHYEDLVAQPQAALEALLDLGDVRLARDLGAAVAAAILADSQEDTSVSREALLDRQVPDDFEWVFTHALRQRYDALLASKGFDPSLANSSLSGRALTFP